MTKYFLLACMVGIMLAAVFTYYKYQDREEFPPGSTAQRPMIGIRNAVIRVPRTDDHIVRSKAGEIGTLEVGSMETSAGGTTESSGDN